MTEKELVIYGKSDCAQCDSLKMRLTSEDIPYTYLLLNTDYGTKELMEIKPLDVRTFPVPFIKRYEDGDYQFDYIKPEDINVMNEDIASLVLLF